MVVQFGKQEPTLDTFELSNHAEAMLTQQRQLFADVLYMCTPEFFKRLMKVIAILESDNTFTLKGGNTSNDLKQSDIDFLSGMKIVQTVSNISRKGRGNPAKKYRLNPDINFNAIIKYHNRKDIEHTTKLIQALVINPSTRNRTSTKFIIQNLTRTSSSKDNLPKPIQEILYTTEPSPRRPNALEDFMNSHPDFNWPEFLAQILFLQNEFCTYEEQ